MMRKNKGLSLCLSGMFYNSHLELPNAPERSPANLKQASKSHLWYSESRIIHHNYPHIDFASFAGFRFNYILVTGQ